MKFELYKDVALARDLPEHRLKCGGIVKPVEHHVAPDRTEGYSAEVFNALGETPAVITVAELIERKTKGENAALNEADIAFHESEYHRLRGVLQAAHDASRLPDLPCEKARAALDDLLVRVRMACAR